jgi:hypothetical protein
MRAKRLMTRIIVATVAVASIGAGVAVPLAGVATHADAGTAKPAYIGYLG